MIAWFHDHGGLVMSLPMTPLVPHVCAMTLVQRSAWTLTTGMGMLRLPLIS